MHASIKKLIIILAALFKFLTQSFLYMKLNLTLLTLSIIFRNSKTTLKQKY